MAKYVVGLQYSTLCLNIAKAWCRIYFNKMRNHYFSYNIFMSYRTNLESYFIALCARTLMRHITTSFTRNMCRKMLCNFRERNNFSSTRGENLGDSDNFSIYDKEIKLIRLNWRTREVFSRAKDVSWHEVK